MEIKIYKIAPDKLNEYSIRNSYRALRLMIIVFIIISGFSYYSSASPNERNATIFGIVFTGILIGGIYLNNLKFARILAENLEFIIDGQFITRTIYLENEKRFNFIHKIALNSLKNQPYSMFSKIDLNEIKSIDLKNGNLVVKGQNANSITGKEIIIPIVI